MPRNICKYCREPVFKRDRCERHYEGFQRKRAASAEAQLHACKKCGKPASLQERNEGRCRVCDPPPRLYYAPFDAPSDAEEAARELRDTAEDVRSAGYAEWADRIDAAVTKWELS